MLKKQLKVSSAAHYNMNLKTNQHPVILPTNTALSVPSTMVTSDGFIKGEMDILWANLKELFALDMADIEVTK